MEKANPRNQTGFQTTYEELKPTAIFAHFESLSSFQTTYEELKPKYTPGAGVLFSLPDYL